MYISWWSQNYNRPLKDPLLLSYTLEELIYEYHEQQERKASQSAEQEQDADKIEEAKEQADTAWADKMEAEEAAEEAAKEAAKAEQLDPSLHPDNVEWMQQQIEKAKEEMGPSFGEDLKVSFDD